MEMECMAVVLLSSTSKADPLPWPITALTYFGYATTAAVLGLPVINTFFKVWQMKAVGDLRGEPLVASLLSYICSFFFSFMQNKWKLNDDSVWLNLVGILFYSVYLGPFFKYANDGDRRAITVKWVLPSAVYILLITLAGLVFKSVLAVKLMYTLAGLASACTPLGLVWFVLERNLQNLPDWLSSALGVLHYAVWATLASFTETDYYDVVQNGIGAFCSLLLLVLLFVFRWKNVAEPAAGFEEDFYEPLIGNQHVIVHVEAITAAQANAIDEADAVDEGHAGVNDEAQAGAEPGAVNQAQPGAIINAQVGAVNQAQAGANDEGQAVGIHEADAIDGQVGANDEAQADANLLPEPLNPQLRKRRNSAPPTHKKAEALRRPSY